MASKNSGSDGSMTGGSGPVKGPYYPKGGAKGGTGKPNTPWTPAQNDKFTKRASPAGNAPRDGAYTDEKGTVKRQSIWAVTKGADGPDGSGNGTNHAAAGRGGFRSKDMKPKVGDYDNWPSSDTTPYGSKNTGKLK